MSAENIVNYNPHAAEVASLTLNQNKSQKKQEKELTELGAILVALEEELANAKSGGGNPSKGAAPQVSGQPSNASQASGAGDSTSFFKMTVGPAALAQKLIYEIMALYSQITELDQKQKVNSIQAQTTEATAQASATEAGGKAAGNAMIASGILAMAGALVSAGVAAFGSMKGTSELKGEQSELTGKMKPLSEVDELSSTAEAEGSIRGVEDDDENKPVSDKTDEELTKLAKDFKNGDFKALNPDKKGNISEEKITDAKAAINRLKGISENTYTGEDANAKEFENFDFDDWRNRTQDRLSAKTNEATTVSQKITTQQMNYTVIAEVLNGATSGVAKAVEGSGTSKKGTYDAIATLNGTASQQAGSTSGDFGKGMSDAYQAQNAEIQILDKIHQTNNIRG